MEVIYKIAYNIENQIQNIMVFMGNAMGDDTPTIMSALFFKRSNK